MPVVRVYEQQNQARPLGGEQLAVSPVQEAFGTAAGADQVNLGRGIGQVGDTLLRTQLKIRDEADQAIIDQRIADYQQRTTDMLYNTDDGILTRSGERAVGAAAESARRMRDMQQDIEKDLNPRQRRLFGQKVTGVQAATNRSTASHEAVQVKQMSLDAYNAKTKTHLDAIMANPAEVDMRLKDMLADANRQRDVQGWSKPQYDAVVADIKGRAHLAVIGTMVDTAPDRALAYYNSPEVKNAIPGGMRKDVEKLLREGTTLSFAQREADRLQLKYGDDYQAARESAKGVSDPFRRKALEDEIDRRSAVASRVRQQRIDTLTTSMYVNLENTGQMPSASQRNQLLLLAGEEGQRTLDNLQRLVTAKTSMENRTDVPAAWSEALDRIDRRGRYADVGLTDMDYQTLSSTFQYTLSKAHWDEVEQSWREQTGRVTEERWSDKALDNEIIYWMRTDGKMDWEGNGINVVRKDDTLNKRFELTKRALRETLYKRTRKTGPIDDQRLKQIVEEEMGPQVSVRTRWGDGLDDQPTIREGLVLPEERDMVSVTVQVPKIMRNRGKLTTGFEEQTVDIASMGALQPEMFAWGQGQPDQAALAWLFVKDIGEAEYAKLRDEITAYNERVSQGAVDANGVPLRPVPITVEGLRTAWRKKQTARSLPRNGP